VTLAKLRLILADHNHQPVAKRLDFNGDKRLGFNMDFREAK
jgi:Ethanolamine utilization protein EutJ (predicted chaperonin)